MKSTVNMPDLAETEHATGMEQYVPPALPLHVGGSSQRVHVQPNRWNGPVCG